MPRKGLINALFLGWLVLWGCQTSPPQPEEGFQGEIQTRVAATLTAQPTATPLPPGDDAVATALAATQAALPTATPLPTETPTPLPTATPTPAPTLTPTLVAGDPRTGLGAPTWQAAFQPSNPSWFVFEDDQTRVTVENGTLVLAALKANNFEAWSLSSPVLDDFYLEVTGTSAECRARDRYGLLFRAPDPNQGYLFGISCDGFFRLRAWDGEQFTQLINWTRSEHILAGSDQTNRLGVMVNGDRLSLYVNGHFLAEVEDDKFDSGRFGAFIAADLTPGFTVKISNAAYWLLD